MNQAHVILATSPGKVILLGEHGAVYGRPAITAALDLRLAVRLEPVPRPGLEIHLPRLQLRLELSEAEIRHYAAEALSRWQRYAAAPAAESFRKVRGEDPAHLVKVALGVAFEAFGTGFSLSDSGLPAGARLEIDSPLPLGSGFGSSAALVTALLRAWAQARNAQPTLEELQELALEAERCQHGSPSGIDTATVLEGGILWARRDPQRGLLYSPLEAHEQHLSRLLLFDSGPPAEDTGTVVAAVRDRFQGEAESLENLLGRMEAATEAFRAALPTAAAGLEIRDSLRAFSRCLEELGVVPDPVQALIRQVEARGGAAKISGAGGLRGPGAGGLLVYHPELGEPLKWPFLASLSRVSAALGASGTSVEGPHPWPR